MISKINLKQKSQEFADLIEVQVYEVVVPELERR